MVFGLPAVEGEMVETTVSRLLSEGLELSPLPVVVTVDRIEPKGSGPGPIKVQLASVQDKVMILRRKKRLENNERYAKVYVRAAKSHAERLIEINFRTILSQIPSGKHYFVTGNGRVMKRNNAADGALPVGLVGAQPERTHYAQGQAGSQSD